MLGFRKNNKIANRDPVVRQQTPIDLDKPLVEKLTSQEYLENSLVMASMCLIVIFRAVGHIGYWLLLKVGYGVIRIKKRGKGLLNKFRDKQLRLL